MQGRIIGERAADADHFRTQPEIIKAAKDAAPAAGERAKEKLSPNANCVQTQSKIIKAVKDAAPAAGEKEK